MSAMYKKRLTKKERDTIWALVNYPTLNDKALAKKTQLKISTITAIRRRLRSKGYYWTVNIPNFYRLGFELMSVEYGSFNEAVPIEKRTKFFKDFVEQRPNTIFSLMSRSNGVVFNVARNYSEASEHFEELEMFLTSHHLTAENGWKKVLFSFKTSKLWNFLNFSPVIRYAFHIQKKVNHREICSDKEAETVRLSKKERRVMYGLVKYPEEPDNNIADRFNVSRQAVSTIKKRFEKEDLISTQRIMDFKHTECNLLTFSYTYFGPSSPLETRKNGLNYIRKIAPFFVGVSGNFDSVAFTATRDYPEYEKMREKLLSFYKTHMSIAKPPEILLFPVGDLCYYKKPTFHMLLGEMLGVNEK